MEFVYYLITLAIYNARIKLNLLKFVILFFAFSGFAQTKLSESLIAVHYEAEKTHELKQVIYKYNFVNHIYTGKEAIMTIHGNKEGKEYLRFDEGGNKLYQNRYLISPKGCILDLQEKKVLHDAPAKLVKCTNDSVIFYINDIFSGAYYSYYNLTKKQYADISDSNYKPTPGQNVEIDQHKSPYKLTYYPKGKEKQVLMEDAGHGGVAANGNKVEVPIYWIDDDSFLFPFIKITDLEGSIVKYTISTKTQKVIGSFNSTAKIPTSFCFETKKNGLVEFMFKDKLHLIHPLKESMLISFYKDIENDFSVSVDAKPGIGRLIYHKGVEVGKNNFELNNFRASENYAAIICNIKMGESAKKRNLSVYSIFKGKWESIYTDNIVSIEGWIKN